MRRPTIFVSVRLLYARLSSTGQNLSRGALALVRPAAVSTRYGIALSRQHRQLSQPVNAVQILALHPVRGKPARRRRSPVAARLSVVRNGLVDLQLAVTSLYTRSRNG